MGVKRIEILNTYYITGYHMCDVRLHRPMWSVGENQQSPVSVAAFVPTIYCSTTDRAHFWHGRRRMEVGESHLYGSHIHKISKLDIWCYPWMKIHFKPKGILIGFKEKEIVKLDPNTGPHYCNLWIIISYKNPLMDIRITFILLFLCQKWLFAFYNFWNYVLALLFFFMSRNPPKGKLNGPLLPLRGPDPNLLVIISPLLVSMHLYISSAFIGEPAMCTK